MSLFKGLFSSNTSRKDVRIELFKALYEPNKQKVIELIEKGDININQYLDNSNSILINAVNCSYQFQDTKEQLELINYLLENNADVNYKNNNGFNALHLALAYHTLSKTSLLLIRNGNPTINDAENKNGNSPIFTAIREYGLTWRDEQKEVNQLRFEIIKELLKRGADLDQKNRHGISSRKWLETIAENDKLHELIKEYDKQS